MATEFSNKVELLGEFYFTYSNELRGYDPIWNDFISFNHIGFPLAYLSSKKLCKISDEARKYVEETWDIFLSTLEISTDDGFDSLDEIMVQAAVGKWPTDESVSD